MGYESWLTEINSVLGSINMSMADWQSQWKFDFHKATPVKMTTPKPKR